MHLKKMFQCQSWFSKEQSSLIRHWKKVICAVGFTGLWLLRGRCQAMPATWQRAGSPQCGVQSIRRNRSPRDWRVAPPHPSGLAHRGLTPPYPSHVAGSRHNPELYLLADINALLFPDYVIPLPFSHSASMTLQIYGYLTLCHVTTADLTLWAGWKAEVVRNEIRLKSKGFSSEGFDKVNVCC